MKYLWALLACLCIALPCGAQDGRATVRVDGRALFRVGAARGVQASQRARQIEARLDALLGAPSTIAPAQAKPSGARGSERLISVADRPIVTVRPSDARDNLLSVEALAARWQSAIDAALSRAGGRRVSAWGRFVAETQSSIATAFGRLLDSAITVIPRLLAGALVLGFFWALASLVRRLMRALFGRFKTDATLQNLIKQIAYYAVWGLGIVVATSALGLDPQALATGLGLTGVALGFALKDILSNFVSGLLILASRPFEIGDQIVIGETEGGVERISLRATQIRTYDGRAVLVPNAEVFTSRITTNTASPFRRGSVALFVGYDADLDAAIRAVRQAAQGSEGVAENPAASVRLRELGADDIVLEARFWTDSRRSDFVATESRVRGEIVAALREAGIGLPDPDVRALVLRDVAAWREVLGSKGSDAGSDGGRAST